MRFAFDRNRNFFSFGITYDYYCKTLTFDFGCWGFHVVFDCLKS